MKFLKLFLLILTLICSGAFNVSADRLYTWTDDKGETHITQKAPPPNGVLKDIMDYRSRPRVQPQETLPQKPKVETREVLVPDVKADDDTCTLNAASGKVNVTVWDYDSAGNRQARIFKGWLEKGARQKITSHTGSIGFSYQRYGNDKSYGGYKRTCEAGNTIDLP